MKFEQKGELSQGSSDLSRLQKRIGPIAYLLALLPSLQGIHDVIHASSLGKYISDPDHVIKHEPLQIKENPTYVSEPIRILGRMGKRA